MHIKNVKFSYFKVQACARAETATTKLGGGGGGGGGWGANSTSVRCQRQRIEACSADQSARSKKSFWRLHFSVIRMGSRGTFMLCTAS